MEMGSPVRFQTAPTAPAGNRHFTPPGCGKKFGSLLGQSGAVHED